MIGWGDDADIYVVVQLASDRTLSRLSEVKAQKRKIVYSVCDTHSSGKERSLAGVNPVSRFRELCLLADCFCVPTPAMGEELASVTEGRPVYVIPDTQDYLGRTVHDAVAVNNKIAWFGNPGKGNFSSAEPYLLHLLSMGKELKLITRDTFFAADSLFANSVIEWNFDTFILELRDCGVCFLSVDPSEQHKSENRLVTSVLNGVPGIVSAEYPSASLLREMGFEYAVVSDRKSLELAHTALSDVSNRQAYLSTMQEYFREAYSTEAIASQYLDMFNRLMGVSGIP